MKFLPLLALLTLALPCSCAGSTVAPGDRLALVRSLPYLEGEAPEMAGKPVVVEFWATWCPPCVQSVPHLVALNERLADDGLVLVGVHAERGADDERTIREFAEARKVDYAIARDVQGGAGAAFGISGIPHAFVYDKSGALVWDGHPMDPAFEAAVDEVVAG